MTGFSPRRRTVFLAALAVLVAFVVLDARREDPTATSAPPRSAKADRSESLEGVAPADASRVRGALVVPERPGLSEPRGELFGPQSWQPSAPKIAAALPAPTPPPNPYRFAGKLLQEGALQVLLSKGDSVFPVKPGDTLDGAYRVEAIGETQITLLYLPLKHREHIPVDSVLEVAAPTAQSASAPAPVAQAVASAGPAPASTAATHRVPQSARLTWEGPRQVKIGAPFSVALRVTSDQPLQGSPMQLRFDPGLLEALAVKPGRFFAAAERNFSYRVNPDGSIFVGASGRGAATAADAELLVVTFKPVKPAAAAELSIASLSLQGPAGRPIAFDRLAAYRTSIAP